MENIVELSKCINQLKHSNEIYEFLSELLTESELNVLSKRWRILNMLNEGFTQREIANKLSVSLCKVTRGAKILKNNNAIVKNFLRKDKTND